MKKVGKKLDRPLKSCMMFPGDGKIQRGEQDMKKAERDQLVKSNQGLVVHFAKKWNGSGVDFLDLVQEGNIGLLHAIDNFDPERGCTFSTYASHWIKKYIRSAVAENRSVHIPEYVQLKIQDEKRQAAKIATLWGHEIKLKEFTECEFIEDYYLNDVPKTRGRRRNSNSVNLSSLPFREYIHGLDMREKMLRTVETLTWTEAIVIRQRLEGYTLKECGKQLHLTAQRVSQFELLAREKMRKSYESANPE